MVSGRGAVVFDNTDFRVVNSRAAPAGKVMSLHQRQDPQLFLRFLAVNSRFNASGDGVAQLGRSLDVDLCNQRSGCDPRQRYQRRFQRGKTMG